MAKYIDAVYVINGIRRRAEQVSLNQTAKFAIDSTIKLLEEIPAVDVVEVRHGEWIDKFNGRFVNPTYICSICGEKALYEFYKNELDQWKDRQALSIRCPHCGAKMDGGKEK